jgi:prolipoprotein diacylglyceryltransferase
LRKRSSDIISTENRIWILIGAASGALLLSRLLGVFENPLLVRHFSAQVILGNKTIVGGLLGGLIGVELTKKIIGVKTSSGDLMTYPIIVAIAIGRIGCFLTGLDDATYGSPSSLPWAIDFGDGIPRHPTNLYEILSLISLFIIIYILEKNFSLADGAKFKLFMIGYLTFRFMTEFIKPDFHYALGLSLIQFACLGGLLYYYRVILHPRKLFLSLTKPAAVIHG